MNILNQTKSIINSKLFNKYCQSQNYYFTRDINEILNEATTKSTVRFKDWNCYDEQDEYLKRVYHLSEYPVKIQLLSEYYKFHHDIARIFQEPVSTILNKYYDKKRKIEYYRIAKIIDQENKNNPHRPPKGIIGEKPSPLNSQLSQPNQEQDLAEYNIKNIQILKELSCLDQLQQQIDKPTKIKFDVSQTLNEICKQIANCPDQSSLFISTNNKNEEIKLNHFLNFINQQSKQQLPQQKQQTKLSQPQEKLIHSIIKQRLPNKQKSTEIQSFLKTQNFDYPSTQSTIDQRQSKTNLYTEENIIKIESKLNEQLKNRSKLRVNKESLKSNSPSNQLNFNSNNTQQILKTQQFQMKINCNNFISKLLIEDQIIESDFKWKNGAQTHRPTTGITNHFNYSPQIQKMKLDNCKILKTKTHHQPPQFHTLKSLPTNRNKEISRKTASQNMHIRQGSNQERIITLQNDQPRTQFTNNVFKEIQPYQSSTHRKQVSDNRALFQKDQIQEFNCLTERRHNVEQLFKNNILDYNNLMKTGYNNIQQGSFQNNIHNNQQQQSIQQLIRKVAKQHQQLYLNNYKNQQNHS
ncbi:unnamed protein product [Paramecium primaurelia]|uniref:Uncharacterized protein n=1 Tax=Paramecium primaurelia TaxID=5886 RepID=A0A8S1NY96_PARPR|nr:unnamed protein product [Paramecium primaurelia]